MELGKGTSELSLEQSSLGSRQNTVGFYPYSWQSQCSPWVASEKKGTFGNLVSAMRVEVARNLTCLWKYYPVPGNLEVIGRNRLTTP